MIVSSKGILDIRGLSALVDEPIFYYLDPRVKPLDRKIIAGWGRKKSFAIAEAYARKHQLSLVCLEDGFIRSLGLGKDGAQPLSLVVDRSGIYFDSRQTSDLEKLIAEPLRPENAAYSRQLIQQIVQNGISKYNQPAVELALNIFTEQENVLVVDQTFGDQSIAFAGASAETFKKMLIQALKDHPTATIWVKTHPDVLAGYTQGHFSHQDLSHPRIKVCAEAYNALELLQQMHYVYVVSSHMGFEALMCGKPVYCFGLPWYAGWGLTDDRHAPLDLLGGRRGVHRSVEHLFECAYLNYARYFSPVTYQPCGLEDILELLKINIQFQKELAGKKQAYGFSRWKKNFIAEFLNFPKSSLKFYSFLKPTHQSPVIAWGKNAQKLQQLGYQDIWAVEDGFVRSTGLGANLIRPYSLVFDDIGIYYDATRLSKLENILNNICMTKKDVERAEKLIEILIKLNITKYNVGEEKQLKRPLHTRVILVTGQVEDDLSVQLGGLTIKTNLDLLKQVRKNHPDAYIIYKPHPDVHAGLRVGQIAEEIILNYADQIELKASIIECFEICDELHTISSLSGFEALLRGLKVYCYGMPFYAGWGLTQDVGTCDRRQKQLTLQQLVYGVLVKYALYNLPQTSAFGVPLVNIEDVIAHIANEKDLGISSPILKSTFAKIRATIIYNIKRR